MDFCSKRKNIIHQIIIIQLLCSILMCNSIFAQQKRIDIPHLSKKGQTTQLIVDGKPFLVLGGELGNSSFTSVEYMSNIWPKLKAMNLNTVLAPVYWELIEPEQGKFDFKLLDSLIEEARNNDLKLVLLWFASWKNSMSSHVPSWVKLNQEKYPRIKDDKGGSHEILTPFSDNNLNADLNAFKALMAHIKKIDKEYHTVIMIQPENEIGMLPTARDYHPLANKKFNEPVPDEFINYLVDNKTNLVPEFYEIWKNNGFKTQGTWQDVFGKGLHTDEIFMAWYYGKYVDKIVKSGKEIYPLPMFVNAALNRPGKQPGEYPSAGPLPHIMDVWMAGAKSIDFLSPDFYNPDFKHWNDLYTRQNNPLFIPEHRFDNTVAAKSVYAIGHYEAIGFSSFSIESTQNPEDESLGKMYHLIAQLTPIITEHQGLNKIEGVLLDKLNPETVFQLGSYEFTVKHSYTLGWEAGSKDEVWEPAGAIVVQVSDSEFYIAGTGIVATFKYLKNPNSKVGILKNEEGSFEAGKWKILRHLNGDQIHQGRHIRISKDDFMLQRLELYTYK